MAKDAAIKKSLEFRRSLLASALELQLPALFAVDANALAATLKDLECDPKSLEDAARFFGLDDIHTSQPYREILLHLLAEAVFGKRKRGAVKGNASAWTPGKKYLLGVAHRELQRRNPKWSDTEIAKAICEEIKEFKSYRGDPEPVRKRLPEARRQLDLWKRRQAAKLVARDVNQVGEWLRDDPKFLESTLGDPAFLRLVFSMMKTHRDRMLSID